MDKVNRQKLVKLLTSSLMMVVICMYIIPSSINVLIDTLQDEFSWTELFYGLVMLVPFFCVLAFLVINFVNPREDRVKKELS